MGEYARLNVFDRCLLDFEDATTHMHIAATCIFDAAPVTKRDGSLDIGSIRRYVDGRLAAIPRYRQRIAYVPLEQHPVWIDDDRFNIAAHVRHVGVPRPGGEKQLKRLLNWIVSQQLDRRRPLWEMWIIEGLEGNRFALCQKVHHAMIDGVAGVEEMAVLLDPDPNGEGVDISRRFRPRAAPGVVELVRDAAVRRLVSPLTLTRAAVGHVSTAPVAGLLALRDGVSGLGSLIGVLASADTNTVLNGAIGPWRRFEWTSFELDAVKTIKNVLGGTINDVVLATVAGALRRYLAKKGASSADLERMRLRAMCPVSRRAESGRHNVGNNVGGMIVEVPVGPKDAAARLAAVRAATAAAKSASHAQGSSTLATLFEYSAPSLLSMVERAAIERGVFNLVVTNIPGPQFPLYMLGARMVDTYPLVPLFPRQGLAIAVLSYAGRLYWGFNADRDLVPDVARFSADIEASFAELASTSAALSHPHDAVDDVSDGVEMIARQAAPRT